jgi:adenylate cyclase
LPRAGSKTTGDGSAEFASVVDAVRCAVDISRHGRPERQRTRRRAAGFPISIIPGIVEQDGDIFGDGVNIAARLEGLSDLAASASRAAQETLPARLVSPSRTWASRC